jgi:hypothetical protein
MDCRKARFDDAEVAFYIVEPYFEAAVDTASGFVEGLGLPDRTGEIRLEIRAEMHDTARHFAGCQTDGRLIAFAPQVVDLPEETLGAIMLHEIGHALDFLYPGVFVLRAGDLDVMVPPNDDPVQMRRYLNRVRQWYDRDDDTVERTADAVAEAMSDRRIGYLGPCLLQTLDAGVPRPKGLR